MNKRNLIVGGLVLLAIAAVFAFKFTPTGAATTELDSFAECLTEKGATFYGAFWCPHCSTQKELFGDSIDKVNYVECSLPDGKGQTEVCKEAGIRSYPTWRFADGSEATGTQQLAQLAQKTGCTL